MLAVLEFKKVEMTWSVHETINQSSDVFILLFCPGKIISSIQ